MPTPFAIPTTSSRLTLSQVRDVANNGNTVTVGPYAFSDRASLDRLIPDQASLDAIFAPNILGSGDVSSAQFAALQEDFMAYKRNQPSNLNRGAYASGTTYSYGDIVTSGSPASAYSYASTTAQTGTAAGVPAADGSNPNWVLLVSAGAAGTAGASAASATVQLLLTAAANPIPAPTAGTYRYVITYGAAATGAITDKLPARQTGLDTVLVKNQTSYNVTLQPPTGGTFDAGQLPTYLLAPGDTGTFVADPAGATSWLVG